MHCQTSRRKEIDPEKFVGLCSCAICINVVKIKEGNFGSNSAIMEIWTGEYHIKICKCSVCGGTGVFNPNRIEIGIDLPDDEKTHNKLLLYKECLETLRNIAEFKRQSEEGD
jgi:hypothetical protein